MEMHLLLKSRVKTMEIYHYNKSYILVSRPLLHLSSALILSLLGFRLALFLGMFIYINWFFVNLGIKVMLTTSREWGEMETRLSVPKEWKGLLLISCVLCFLVHAGFSSREV